MSFRELVVETIKVPPVTAAPSPRRGHRCKNNASLLQLASDILGYQAPVPQRPEPTAPPRSYPLAEALRSIGCCSFTAVSVGRYKAKVVRAAQRRARRVEKRLEDFFEAENLRHFGLGDIFWDAFFVVVLGFSLGILGSLPVVVRYLPSSAANTGYLIGGGFGTVVSLLVVVLIILKITRIRGLTDTERAAVLAKFTGDAEQAPYLAWAMTPLASYQDAVPDPVRALACEVVEACPSVELYVHHTVVERVVNAMKVRASVRSKFRDPFLEVRLGDESYFIAVWDERDYRAAWDKTR